METPIEFVRNLQFFYIMLNTLHLNACLKIICQSLRGCHPLFLHNIFILHYWFSGFPFMMTMVKMVMMMQVVVAKIAILLGSWWIGDGGRTTCKAKKKPIQVSSHHHSTLWHLAILGSRSFCVQVKCEIFPANGKTFFRYCYLQLWKNNFFANHNWILMTPTFLLNFYNFGKINGIFR